MNYTKFTDHANQDDIIFIPSNEIQDETKSLVSILSKCIDDKMFLIILGLCLIVIVLLLFQL